MSIHIAYHRRSCPCQTYLSRISALYNRANSSCSSAKKDFAPEPPGAPIYSRVLKFPNEPSENVLLSAPKARLGTCALAVLRQLPGHFRFC